MFVSEIELSYRKRRYSQILDQWLKSQHGQEAEGRNQQREKYFTQIRPLLENFLDGDVASDALKSGIQSWSQGKPITGFGGYAGAMTLNQLIKHGNLDETDSVLRSVLVPPSSLEVASDQINTLSRYLMKLQNQGGDTGKGRAPYFASWFWWMQNSRWQPIWPNAEKALVSMSWFDEKIEDQGERYKEYWELLTGLSEDVLQVSEVLSWFKAQKPNLPLDETIQDRIQRSYELPWKPEDGNRELWSESLNNTQIILSELKRVGLQMKDLVSAQIGREVSPHTPGPFWAPSEQHIRGSSWVAWHLEGEPVTTASIRLNVSSSQNTITLNIASNRNPKGSTRKMRGLLRESIPENLKILKFSPSDKNSDLIEVDYNEKWTDLGVELGDGLFNNGDSFEKEIKRGLEKIQPMLLMVSNRGVDDSDDEGHEPLTDLASLAEQFKTETGYPTEKDLSQKASGDLFNQWLGRDRLPALDKTELRKIIASRYGSPGPMSILNETIRDADDAEWERLLKTIDFLVWGEGDTSFRIDQVLESKERSFRGLGVSVVMKLLSVAHPDEATLVYPLLGNKGKNAVLKRIGLEPPPLNLDMGAAQIRAGTQIRELLSPHFPGDPYGQMLFAYWLLDENGENGGTGDTEEEIAERLAAASDSAYLDTEYLESIYSVLKRKRQIIFYGPPGTGKTFIAMKLAEAIAPLAGQRALVQFHASTSYEDFVEGFRPDVEDGNMVYKLVPGPLRNIATLAEDDPNNTYVLVIDEINRANLPKVLGELLFLLEYRDQIIKPMYRPDEEFSLPANLWIIGTMNTADQSIAQIDLALRRRFTFVPLTPDIETSDTEERNQVSSVLARWVDRNSKDELIPVLVDVFNQKLVRELNSDQFVLGPSYFMDDDIDEKLLREIWKFQIAPLIEELFYNKPDKKKLFTFDTLWSEINGN